MKVGISFVSVSNARENVQQENPLWDFPAVKARASAAWNAILQKIQVTGGTTVVAVISQPTNSPITEDMNKLPGEIIPLSQGGVAAPVNKGAKPP